jgi:predicted RNA-binding protein YlxR (DUF448 family)
LVRVACDANGDLVVSRTAPGRGAWVCALSPEAAVACQRAGVARGGFARAFRSAIDAGAAELAIQFMQQTSLIWHASLRAPPCRRARMTPVPTANGFARRAHARVIAICYWKVPVLPKNIRLHELAKELGMTNKETLDLSVALGIGVKSHSSSIEEPQADRVRRRAQRDGLTRDVQPEEPEKPRKAVAK